MQLEVARQLAVQLLGQHNLLERGWSFRFDRARTRFGCCNYRDRVISLSRLLTERNELAEVQETLLHEIAHALVGAGAGHGPVWKRKAVEIGCSGARCHSADMPQGQWQASCSGCGRTYYRHRQPKRNYSCGQCSNSYNPQYQLVFSKAG